jgi:hypothetical protein
MGLGTARLGSNAQAGDSLTTALDLARDARGLLPREVDPIEARDIKIRPSSLRSMSFSNSRMRATRHG